MSITAARAIYYSVLLIISLTPLDLITAWIILSTLWSLIFFIKSQFHITVFFLHPHPSLGFFFFWLLILWMPHAVLNYMLISEYADYLSRRQISEPSEINFPTPKFLGTSFQFSPGISWWCRAVQVSPHLPRAATRAPSCSGSFPAGPSNSRIKTYLN